MSKYFYSTIWAAIILVACQSSAPQSKEWANEITLLEKSDTQINVLAENYLAYANTFPEDSLTPKYLLTMAKNHLKNTPQRDSAAFYAQRVFKDYEKSSYAPEAMFFYASMQSNPNERIHWYNQTYETFKESEWAGDALVAMAVQYENMGNREKALEVYGSYLAAYPNGEHAQDVKLSIKNIDVPLEELIQQFEEQQNK